MRQLPQIIEKSIYEKPIYDKIVKFYNDLLFSFMDRLVKDKSLRNEGESIASAIWNGNVIYTDGVYKSRSGRFSNKLSRDFERLGAKWRPSLKGYYIKPANIPPVLEQAVSEVRIKNQDKLNQMLDYLNNLDNTIEYATRTINFTDEVEGIGEDLDRQFKRSMRTINVIPPDLTSYQLQQIAQNYTYNLNYYIKKWAQEEIFTLREEVNKMVMQGYRAESLEDFISKREGISRRKAKFLARQETKLLVAEYRKNRFKQEGVTTYIWSTNLDGRERELHRELNGKIFSWSEPPIIDARTGETGNPGEAYNCRCRAIPVIDEKWWRNS